MIEGERMGVTIIKDEKGEKLTFSCATCHATSLFGKQIIGLNNKRPRTNEVFVLRKIPALVHPWLFKLATGATKVKLKFIPGFEKTPRSTGVLRQLLWGGPHHTQVALSLAKRNEDDYITKNLYENFPRFNELQQKADSKPAVEGT